MTKSSKVERDGARGTRPSSTFARTVRSGIPVSRTSSATPIARTAGNAVAHSAGGSRCGEHEEYSPARSHRRRKRGGESRLDPAVSYLGGFDVLAFGPPDSDRSIKRRAAWIVAR